MKIKNYKLVLNKENRLPQLVEEPTCEYSCGDGTIDQPEKIVKICNTVFHLSDLAEEHTILLAVGGSGKLLGVFELSHGNNSGSIVDPKSIMIRLLLTNATAFAIVHNHPSGRCEPSRIDVETTKRLKQAADLMDFLLLDHIIIGDGKYRSMREAGDCEF